MHIMTVTFNIILNYTSEADIEKSISRYSVKVF